MHADCGDVDQFVDMLRPHYDGEIVVGDIGPVVGSHAGTRHHRRRVPRHASRLHGAIARYYARRPHH